MSVPIEDVATYLDERLRIHEFDEPDSNGLLLRASDEVRRVAVAVSASHHAIEGAAAAGAQLLLTHHPSWERFDLGHAARKREILGARGLSHYAAHSSLDGAPGISNSDGCADALGVRVERRFLSYCGGLAGIIGRADGTFAELVERAGMAFGVPVESWANAATFGVVAIASGRADTPQAIEEARTLGADTYVTGEGNMWTKLYARESGVNLVFGTHYATETYGVKALGRLIEERFGLPCTFVPEANGIR